VEIEKRLAHDTSDNWVRRFNDAGVACGHISDMKQALDPEACFPAVPDLEAKP
jgi:crotonobetainyl-CoA:carnitine CoA-transferase CaiB-like acyl-CoA transferase